MLNTVSFIEKLIEKGYSHFCVVPCSFAKNLINASINYGDKIEYIPCASEAVACSVAAGLKISKKSPIVIVQSSGLTNMGSCITSLMIPYGINFPIIVSWRTYKKGGSEIQHKHLSRKLPDLIDAYGFSYVLLNKDSSEYAVSQIMDCELKNQICVLEEDSFSEVALGKEYALDLSPYPKRSGFLKILNNFFMGTDVVFIGTTGNTSREMYYFMPDCNNFYMAGNMGGALSVGLGISKSNRKVVVCGGDAEFAMHMGGMVTAGRYSKEVDLTYILFDNESNKSTGGQGTYQDHINYTNIAKNSNFSPLSGSMGVINLSKFKEAILLGKSIGKGVKFIHVKCSYDSNVSRPSADEISKYPISNLEAE